MPHSKRQRTVASGRQILHNDTSTDVHFDVAHREDSPMLRLAAPVLLRLPLLIALFCLMPAPVSRLASADDWQAGFARRKITPERPMWMSGYAGRDHAAEGTLIDLWAKAVALQDSRGERVVLVGLDLVGIDRDLSVAVCETLQKTHGLKRSQIALNCSHTHTGPVVGRNLMTMYTLDPTQAQLVADYTHDLEEKIVAAVGDALAALAPARLAWGSGHCTVAVNRRNNVETDVARLRAQGLLKGPVDYDVPVLSIRRPDGGLAGVIFGYACHATVLPIFRWSGDYPGYAQLALEEAHPGATAIFFAGCGGDQNPLPRRLPTPPTPQAGEEYGVSRAEEYGRTLARSVDAVLNGHMPALTGALQSTYREVDLAFDKLPTREEIEKESKSDNKYAVSRAKMLLGLLDGGKPLAPAYPYPVQFWKLGSEVKLVTLGGEVVIDYAVRLKQELGGKTVWVAGYSNDVMAYIPSLRVLKE
ncbi:MAG: hypothetical protein EHM42_10450, partial [Planctomycetaceae bacterium]